MHLRTTILSSTKAPGALSRAQGQTLYLQEQGTARADGPSPPREKTPFHLLTLLIIQAPRLGH